MSTRKEIKLAAPAEGLDGGRGAVAAGLVQWVIECESADRPGEWGQLEIPRTEERAHKLMAEWREWLDKNTRTWRAVRLVKVVTTREIVPSPNGKDSERCNKMTSEQIAEWTAWAAECERAAARAESEAARAKNTMEYNRWTSHANNFAETARRVWSLLPTYQDHRHARHDES